MIWEPVLQALSPYILVVTLAGVSLGIIWGAMPGLSTTMAMALLIGLSASSSQGPGRLSQLGGGQVSCSQGLLDG